MCHDAGQLAFSFFPLFNIMLGAKQCVPFLYPPLVNRYVGEGEERGVGYGEKGKDSSLGGGRALWGNISSLEIHLS